jgi:mannose-6-phosphate isomerase-like protein (cupin superfamily)
VITWRQGMARAQRHAASSPAREVNMSIDPSQTFVLLAADGRAVQVPGAEAFWSRPKSELDEFGQSWLVSEFECSSDWPNWEMHPEADEFVYLLSGEAIFQLQGKGGTTSIPLRDRGALVIPRGVWHTAKVLAASRMLFVTLGAGTQHRPVRKSDDRDV